MTRHAPSPMLNAEPPGEGWQPFVAMWPPQNYADTGFARLASGRCLELWRREWGNETRFASEKFHPATNIAGLYWRPAS